MQRTSRSHHRSTPSGKAFAAFSSRYDGPMRLPLLLLLSACTGTSPADTETEPEAAPIATYQFSFAVIADPHLSNSQDHVDRFADALDWIDAESDARGIEVVLLAGDIAWGNGFPDAVRLLADTVIPVAPMIGDNEIASGDEEVFHTSFTEHYVALESTLDGWRMAERPVHNPEHGVDSWLFNFAFEHRDVRFVGLDWSPRNETDRVLSEMGTLHNFEGGTLPFLVDELASATNALDSSVVMLTHQPMYLGPGGFFLDNWATLTEAMLPYDNLLGINVAGHLHQDSEFHAYDTEVDLDVWITDALWDDVVTVRIVDVWSDGQEVTYETVTEVVPH